MPSTRPRLMLDEQSFQGLLAAAFTIQQYNDRQNIDRRNQNNDRQNNNDRQSGAGAGFTVAENEARAKPQPAELCRHCGVPLPAGQTPCPSCGAENFRPGERLQRTWASLWQMSQVQGFHQELRESTAPGGSPSPSKFHSKDHDPAGSNVAAFSPIAKSEPAETEPKTIRETPQEPTGDFLTHHPSSFDNAFFHHPELDLPPAEIVYPGATHDDLELSVSSSALSGNNGSEPIAAGVVPKPIRRGLLDLWAKLRSHRADLYLAIAVLVAALALLWPAPAWQRPRLRAWERILIAMGIADAPAPAVHYRGDPNIKVWVDTHTALYYCPGEELYGKSPDGHFSTQREAQYDRFEPAERSACVE